MKRLIRYILDLFSIKSPCCHKPMSDVGYHEFLGGSISKVYECKKCKRQWI